MSRQLAGLVQEVHREDAAMVSARWAQLCAVCWLLPQGLNRKQPEQETRPLSPAHSVRWGRAMLLEHSLPLLAGHLLCPQSCVEKGACIQAGNGTHAERTHTPAACSPQRQQMEALESEQE